MDCNYNLSVTTHTKVRFHGDELTSVGSTVKPSHVLFDVVTIRHLSVRVLNIACLCFSRSLLGPSEFHLRGFLRV